MVLENKIEEVIFKFKKVTLFMLPYFLGMIIYFWNLDIGDPAIEAYYGGLVYLSIGYTGITLYSFLLCDVILSVAKDNKNIKWFAIIVLEILIVSLVVVLSCSRGVLLSWMFINIIISIILIVKKQKRSLWVVGMSVLGIVLFYIITPPDNVAISRQLGLVNEIKRGVLQQSMTSEESRKLLDQMYEQGGLDVALNILEDIETSKRDNQDTLIDCDSISEENDSISEGSGSISEEGEINQLEIQDLEETVRSVTNGSMSRSYLWQLVFKEVKTNPFFGMGVLGYQIKYGTYPHNILLEVMVDFGIPLFVIFFVACIMLFIYYVKNAIKSWVWACITIYLCSQVLEAMLSGDLYVSGALLLAATLFLIEKCGYRESYRYRNSSDGINNK